MVNTGRRNGAGARTFFFKCSVFCRASKKRISFREGGLVEEIWVSSDREFEGDHEYIVDLGVWS